MVLGTDFSPLAGGPAYRVLARAGFARRDARGVVRTAGMLALVTWVPLVGLSAAEGAFAGQAVTLAFSRDFAAHARLLVAVPLFLVADLVVGARLALVIRQLVESGVVPESEERPFELALGEVARGRDSNVAESLLLVVSFVMAAIGVRWQAAEVASTWVATTSPASASLTAAGWWYAAVSLPVFLFLLLRWFWRGFLWSRFLARVARLDLRLVSTHPDAAGGLAFVAAGQTAFGIVVFSVSAVLSASLAARVLYAGAHVVDFKAPLAGYLVLALVLVFGPLAVLARPLAFERRRALARYSTLMTAHNRAFERRWLDGGTSTGDEILGSADPSSLADLGAAFAAVQQMRVVPLSRDAILGVIVLAAAPMVPLVALQVPLKDVLIKLVGILA